MKPILTILLACCYALTFAQKPLTSKQIDSLVSKTMSVMPLAAISVAVIKDGKVVHSKGVTPLDEEEMRRRLALLKTEHRDLDAAIYALSLADGQDQLQIARMKKRKLRLKDQIAIIEDYLTPDIIA